VVFKPAGFIGFHTVTNTRPLPNTAPRL